MNYSEALRLLCQYNRVRRKEWPPEAYLRLKSSGRVVLYSDVYNDNYYPCSIDIFADDWEIWEIPEANK